VFYHSALHDFAEVGLRRELGLQAVEEEERTLCFRWRGKTYHISLIPSTAACAQAEPARSVRQIFLVNRAGWTPPPGATVFDLVTMQAPFVSDPIHTALRLFMRRYYGVKFAALPGKAERP
jgi:hypothetical protein